MVYNLWQECQFWNRTFEEESEKVDVDKVHSLLYKNGEERLG